MRDRLTESTDGIPRWKALRPFRKVTNRILTRKAALPQRARGRGIASARSREPDMSIGDPKSLWAQSVDEELQWWDSWLKNEGLTWGEDYADRFSSATRLSEPLIVSHLNEFPEETIAILDVGAGPLTILGKTYPGKVVQITPVDPLADGYNRLLRAANLSAPVATVACDGEELCEHFTRACFHFSFSRNALDHCYDPLRVIRNMVAVTRPGGYVVLRHLINESEHADHQGLHQWNFDIVNDRCILWNASARHDLAQALSDTCEMQCWFEDDWVVCSIRKR